MSEKIVKLRRAKALDPKDVVIIDQTGSHEGRTVTIGIGSSLLPRPNSVPATPADEKDDRDTEASHDPAGPNDS